MTGKIVIFGASGGVGAETCRILARRGQALHLVARDAQRLEALARETGASFHSADVEEEGSIAAAIDAAGASVEGLLYAVGTINLKPISRLSREDFERDFRVNALGAAHAVKAVLPALKAYEKTASVVLMSSVAVQQGFAGHGSISMAKGAVEGFTRALAAELAPKVRVNAIAPSLIRTGLAVGITGNETMAQAIAQMHPLQRLGEPADVAGLAAFLLSQESAWMTGQVIGVDGGRSTLRLKG